MASPMFLPFLAALFVGLAEGKGVIVFKAGNQQLGLYFKGRQDFADLGNVAEQPATYEYFLGVVSPHEEKTINFKDFDAFEIRAADMQTRMRIVTYANSDQATKFDQPYKLSFYNFMSEGRNVELKLSKQGGYTWIEPGHVATQVTSTGHVFELRDPTKTTFASVRLDRGTEL
eukprot:TRINITY_DN73915_c0_g1_i1.p1 TRINITY_DN73915_c0_g1~~TRINITY_DN73915_c0_g1_i1.p1  ORF type:complete len:173 (-),score=26.97 TRINITY_DN73915_c0_g1_i1:60-578(-)